MSDKKTTQQSTPVGTGTFATAGGVAVFSTPITISEVQTPRRCPPSRPLHNAYSDYTPVLKKPRKACWIGESLVISMAGVHPGARK